MLHVPASRLRLRSTALLLLAAASVLATACGGGSSSGKLLSTQQASELRASLSQVEQDVAAKNCSGAAERVAALKQQIDSINRLDSDLRSSLRASVRRLDTLVSDSCQTTAAAPTGTTTTTPTPDTGATGATGPTGKEKHKVKKEKQSTPPGQGDQGQQNGGGGAGVPGETNPNGNGN
jgi:hypothetical protein